MQHLRRLIILLFVLSFTVGILAALNLATAIGQPFGGFFAGYLHAAGIWQVEASTPPWWPAIASNELRYDDELVAIDGQPYDSQAYAIYSSEYRTGGASVHLIVKRKGELITVNQPLRIFSIGNYLDMKLPDLINGLGFWLLGAAVFRAHAHNPVNRTFALASCFAAGAIWLTIQGLFVEAPGFTRILQLAWVVLASYVGASFIHLTLLFPDPMRRPFARYIRFLYAVMTVVAVLYLASFLVRWQVGPTAMTIALAKYCNIVVVGSAGIGAAAYLARLIYILAKRNISRRLRRQSIFLLLGVILAMPYVIVIVLRSVMQSPQAYFVIGFDIRYLTLAVPLSFAFVILRYQTLQRIHRAVAVVFILATSALLASLTTWVMRLVEPTWVNTLNWSPFVPVFIASILTAAFYSLQNTLRGALSKVFQWEFRSYTAVRRFTQQVVEQTDPVGLPATITRALVDKLELECASVWLWEERAKEYRLAGSAGAWPAPPPEQLPLGDPSRRLLQPLLLNAGPDSAALPDWLDPLRLTGRIEVVAPLAVSGEPIGLLGLGKRWDEEIFDNRDLEIIEVVALQAALFILTAEQIQQLRQVPHQITSAQERERFKIAQELHDTVQQFLGRLPFYLQVSRDNARTDPAETESILQRCIADVEGAAQAVRQIRNSLAPLQLESSLVQPLTTLIDDFRARTGIEALTDFSPEADSPLSLQARHALYRVVQQALDNIAAHANATRVTIALKAQNSHLHFTIADNGRGSTDAQRRDAAARGSFGLTSMQARISALGGEFHFESEPAAGTTINGWLPL